MNDTQHDPVAVMQHLEQAIWHLEQARLKSGGSGPIGEKPVPRGMAAMLGYGAEPDERHELDDAIRWLNGEMDRWLAKYGRMLWEASDSHSTLGMPTGDFPGVEA